MLSEEISKWTQPEKVAGEMLLRALADVVDDYKATEAPGMLDFSVFYDWVGDIPGLLNTSWLSDAARDSLTLAYEEAKAVNIIASLRINGLLPFARQH